jgi:YrbI family 3-deoxy-D-manno-octulosonate 8-phosphate phosphatase
MVARVEILALIPARGGSKGIPHKNAREFAGFPLVAYSIAAGLQSELVTRVIVSTDDPMIAEISRGFGAEVPFLRPVELAHDNTLDLPVFEQALRWLKEHEEYVPEVVVQLRPTSPVRPRTCVDEAVRLLMAHPEADSVRGVVPSGQNPHKMWRIDPENGNIVPLLKVEGLPEPYNAPRQVLPQTYWQTGHIDAIRTGTILDKGSMSGEIILPLFIEPRYTVDIDNLDDWARSEWLVNQGGLDMVYPGVARRSFPQKVEMVVFDFDGVMTDNRVWVDQDGRELVAANRSDSLGLNEIRRLGVRTIVLSTETNPVVSARCQKLDLEFIQGVEDKAAVLRDLLIQQGIDPLNVIYVGNDINDVSCFPLVGCAVVVSDAHVEARRKADVVLSHTGGHGAVRELCDLIVNKLATL